MTPARCAEGITLAASALAPRTTAPPSLGWIGRAATVALYDELALYPKPGLVSFVDTGSHDDMTAGTFLRSLFSLRHYFQRITALGAAGAGFDAVEAAGIGAEQAMLRATHGINTHRGAIFSLGLLCAAAGWLAARHRPVTPAALRETLQRQWGTALQQRGAHGATSHGRAAVRQHGLRGANEEAALGMPLLFDIAVPVLQRGLAAGLPPAVARLDTFFHVMAGLDDTNLVHRGGLAALRDAQQAARDYIAAGGAAHPQGQDRALALHRAFVARRLSPGGAADLLAAACWVVRVGAGRTGRLRR